MLDNIKDDFQSVLQSREFVCVFCFVSCKTSQNVNISQLLICSSKCDKISSLPVFHVNEKFTHQVIYFNIKLSNFYVRVKIYTSSLLDCHQFSIFNLKYIFVHQSERRYFNVSVANIFMPSSPSL